MANSPSITIRELATLAEYQACVALQDETWGDGFSERVPSAILRVSQKIGGVTAGAFDSGGKMLGFVFGMTGIRDGRLAHWSDMLAVREEARGHHIGEQLKQYQRDRCIELGVQVMFWTFDPLVARNAHLNLNKLGASVAEYAEDMYGSNTGSTLHGAVPTDRFVAAWDLTRSFTPTEGADLPGPGDAALPLVNPLDDHGRPMVRAIANAPNVRVQVPAEAEGLRARGADLPLTWRLAVRNSVVPLLARGYAVTRFVRAHEGTLPYYVLTHPST
jgi:predicted GNAT superfamily acetyltransferase